MTFKKRLLKNSLIIWLLSHLLALLVRLLYFSCRVERRIPETAAPYLRGQAPVLLAFWHGRLGMQPFMRPPQRPAYVLISKHADGRLISAMIKRFGIDTIQGSRGKNVHAALSSLERVAAEGGILGITPDGPRGPFQKAADGAAFLAITHRYPVVGLAFSATRYWRFKSWDRFFLPKPFSRLCYVASEPMIFEASADIAAATALIEATLNRVTAAADEACKVVA